MKCANPICQHNLLYLRGGTLRLLELEGAPESRPVEEAAGFAIRRRSARYFWLCADCSRILILRRWTPDGLVLESRSPAESGPPRTWIVGEQSGLDAQSIVRLSPTQIRPI